MTFSSGQKPRFPGITIVSSVSRGGFGQVFYGICSESKQQVAVKEVAFSRSCSGRQRGPRLENEPEIQSGLKHGNIVTLIRYWKADGCLCMVFEWMECNLSQFLKGRRIAEPVKKTYIQMLLQAVTYLHDRHIMHRDINPRNLLVAGNGVIKLGDFGLAKSLDPNSSRKDGIPFSSAAGTRQYRAPELLFGCVIYDYTVDLWSVGCTSAEIYTNGHVLFESETDIGQIGQIISIFGDPVQNCEYNGAQNWPDYGKIVFKFPEKPHGVACLLPAVSAVFLNFLNGFLLYDPSRRTAARDAMNSEYLTTINCLPCPVEKLPQPPGKIPPLGLKGSPT